ncbi:MAG: hypothetical protein E7331_07375 [Clostridiales bacterium]|nr:hypothetical protein [Clostridiales bacterium]
MTRNNRDKRSNLPEGDDGRTIANMNVEGMPWYTPERPGVPGYVTEKQFKDGLDKKQMRMYTASALKAGLLVTLIMCAGIVLFVAFCVYIWFR